MARVQPSKKPLFPEMGQASKLGYTPHPPSTYAPTGSSGPGGHCRNPKGPRSPSSFLDFLAKSQVLDSLQTVVEETTEHTATMKTEGGVPLVEVQDPVEVLRVGLWARARPSLSTVCRHHTRPSLCIGYPNNYPSCSSSASPSQSSFTAGWLGSHSHLGALSWGSLPPMRNKLLLEKNPKQLLRLENRRSPSYMLMRKKPLPSISSESTMSHLFSLRYQELVSSLEEQAVSLLIFKYRFEKNLTRNLGFISFPVTETLTDLFLGFQKLKGSRISLSLEMNWSCPLRKPEEAEQTHQASHQASRSTSRLSDLSHHASHRSTIHHSPECPSMLPAAATQEDPAEAAEHCLSMESPGPQQLTLQETTAATEQEPPARGSPSTPRCTSPALAPVTLRKRWMGAEEEPQSPPKPPGAVKVSHSTEAGRGDPP